jgi:RNA polymerase sigma factor (sigma-70 family)
MVMGVARRVLRQRQDAEDVFQATFLVLARKAGSMRWRESVGNWLYGVAYRLALEARTRLARRRERDIVAPEPCARPDGNLRELCVVLDEELRRLPVSYRQPLLLCYLEGQTRDRAAREMGWSLRTLHRRLERGLGLLRARLTARGLTLSAALVAAELSRQAASASLSGELLSGTVQSARIFAARTGGVPTTAAMLAEGGLRSASAVRVKIALAVLMATLSAVGAGLFAHQAPARPQPEAKGEAQTPPTQTETARPADEKRITDPLPPGALARLGTSRLRGHRCRFLPDSRRLVRERSDGSLQIFAVPTGEPLARIHGTDIPGRKEIIGSTIAFTRDGKYVAAVCWEGRCGIWETATGKLVRWLESGRFYSIVRCDFSGDGKWLAVGAGVADGKTDGITVGVYEVATGRQLFTTPGTNSVFAPDGRSLVTWNGYLHGATQMARRVAVPSGEELSTFSYGERFSDFAPRSDGLLFFEVLADNRVRVLDVASGDVQHTFDGPEGGGGHDKPVYVRHVHGRRELIVVTTHPPGAWCRDLDTGKELWRHKFTSPVYFPELSADGKTLITGEKAGTVRVWDVASGKERTSFRPDTIGHSVDSLAISPDGKTVATNSGGIFSSSVALWDATNGKLLSDLPGHPSAITATTFAPDGAKIYTIGKDRTLRTWDPASGRELSRAGAEPSTSLAVSPDGKTLFAAGEDGSIRVLDAQTGRVERRLAMFKKALVGMALTADGQRLVVAGRDGDSKDSLVVRVCEAGTGAKIREFGKSDAAIEQLAVRPDGAAIATSHVGQRVVLWDAKGEKLSEQRGQGERISAWRDSVETPYRIGSLGISPNGRWLAYSDQEKGVAIVDVRSRREIGRAKLDVFYQNGAARTELRDVLAFSPDGKMIAWSGVESTADIFLIEVRTHQVRRRLPGDSYLVQQLAFSPDGSRLLSAGPDGSALIWDVRERSAPRVAAAARAEAVASSWDALADESAVKGYATMRGMAIHPSQAVELLRAKLKPIVEVEAGRLDALLAKLGDDAFAVREEASRALVELGEPAGPRLEAAARKSPDLEVQRRAADTLEKIDASRLQAERAVEVLEMIGDASARKLLRELAGGLRGAARTTDAADALARLAKTP